MMQEMNVSSGYSSFVERGSAMYDTLERAESETNDRKNKVQADGQGTFADVAWKFLCKTYVNFKVRVCVIITVTILFITTLAILVYFAASHKQEVWCNALVPDVENGMAVRDIDAKQKAYLDTATVTCVEGYRTEKPRIMCQASGVWESSACQKIVCGSVPAVRNGKAVLDNSEQMSYLDKATVTCYVGYQTAKPSIQCQANGLWESVSCKEIGIDCKDILEKHPAAPSGVYKIQLNTTKSILTVYCDMEKEGGGWTVFHNRFDGSVDFYRDFSEYENGFGDVRGEFWLGLKHIQQLVMQDKTEIRLEMKRNDGEEGYEAYQDFKLSGDANYKLSIDVGSADRSVGISAIYCFAGSNGYSFATFDTDAFGSCSCAEQYHGGWWYGSTCTMVNLNGKYCTPGTLCGDGKYPKKGHYHYGFSQYESLMTSRMMIKRV